MKNYSEWYFEKRNKDLLYEKLLGVILRKNKQRFTLGKITRSDNSKKETKIYFMKNYSEW